MKKAYIIPNPPQKFPTIHKENVEKLSQQHSQEVLDKPVTPEQYENFHRVVNRMITDSELSDHDKMIARKQWNRTQKEVQNKGVSQVSLSTWQKMLMGTCLLAADKIGSEKRKVQWKGYKAFLATSFSVKEFEDDGFVLPFSYDSKDDYEEAATEAGQEPDDKGWFDQMPENDEHDDEGIDEDPALENEDIWVETNEPVYVPTRKEEELTDYEEKELASRLKPAS